jgi:hypothetical protein
MENLKIKSQKLKTPAYAKATAGKSFRGQAG